MKQFITNAVFLSIIAVLLGVVCVTLSYAMLPNPIEILATALRDFGILFASVGIVSILYDTLIRRNLLNQYNEVLRSIVDPDARRLGVAGLFRDRTASREFVPSYFVANAKRSIDLLGLGLYSFVPEQQRRLLEKMRDGCQLRCLIFDNDSAHAPMFEKSLGQDGLLVDFMAGQRDYFRNFLNEAQKLDLLKHVEIRLYDLVPAWGLIAIDRGTVNGLIKVEIYGTRIEGSQCPGFVVVNTHNGWYTFFSEQFEKIWQASKPLEFIQAV